MCLYTDKEKPLVASRDIKVYKHVSTILNGYAKSPCQGTEFRLNEEFTAEPSTVDISKRAEKVWEINGGVIHACM